jgi:predicted nucleic acid-binding protein
VSREVVIDASAIIAVVTNEPEKPVLIQLTRGAELLAPLSIPWEIGNAFSAMLRRRRISVEQAIQAIAIYRTIPIRLVEVELEEAIQLADQLNLYAYDAYLLRCAARYHAPLLSLDRDLLTAATALGLPILEVH